MKTIDELRAEINATAERMRMELAATHKRQMGELRKLDAELDALKKQSDEWPKDGDEYYAFNDNFGTACCMKWCGDLTDRNKMNYGNVHRTKAEAIQYGERLKAEAAIRRKIGGRVGEYFPMLTRLGEPTWTCAKCNSFGCIDTELAIEIAKTTEFRFHCGVNQ